MIPILCYILTSRTTSQAIQKRPSGTTLPYDTEAQLIAHQIAMGMSRIELEREPADLSLEPHLRGGSIG